MTPNPNAAKIVNHGGWVGAVPESWAVGPLRRFCSVTLGKMVAQAASEGEFTQPYLRAAHVQPGGVLSLVDVKRMPFTIDETKRLGLLPGDVVVVEGGAGFGRSAVLREGLPGWGFQNSINRVRALSGDGRFANYALLAAQASGHFETLINTATIPHLTAEKLLEVQVAWPAATVQRQVADYLDVHTAKIDELIEKQERLIEALAERRQAVISHAVTKGLDQKASMKDSGVEWLGFVPERWTVTKVGHVTDVLTGFPFKSDDYSSNLNDVRLLRGANVNAGQLVWDDVVYWPRRDEANYAAYRLEEGDLVLGLDRPIVSSGTRVARVESTDLPALLLQRVARIRARANTDVVFLFYLLSGPEFRDYLTPIFTGVSVPHMSPEQLKTFHVALPPVEVQRAIVEHLDHETAQIDLLSAKAREMIDVLKERRQALISAAVTGKIDVRGWIDGDAERVLVRG